MLNRALTDSLTASRNVAGHMQIEREMAVDRVLFDLIASPRADM
jgi:hypothetical protein